MKSICTATIALSLMSVLGSNTLADETPKSHNGKFSETLEKKIVPDLVKTIGLLGYSNLDQALDQLDKNFGPPAELRNTPQAQLARAKWKQVFGPFGKTKMNFENVELIGLQRISSQAFSVILIASGNRGPMLFQCKVYEYRGKPKLIGLRFTSVWEQVEAKVATIRKPISKKYPIPVQLAGGLANQRIAQKK
ncbi:MAG: hypothetical protein Tsb009_06520 [Planctomycetaceae bacterium]